MDIDVICMECDHGCHVDVKRVIMTVILLMLAMMRYIRDVNAQAATDFVASCRNFDGGFGAVPGAI